VAIALEPTTPARTRWAIADANGALRERHGLLLAGIGGDAAVRRLSVGKRWGSVIGCPTAATRKTVIDCLNGVRGKSLTTAVSGLSSTDNYRSLREYTYYNGCHASKALCYHRACTVVRGCDGVSVPLDGLHTSDTVRDVCPRTYYRR